MNASTLSSRHACHWESVVAATVLMVVRVEGFGRLSWNGLLGDFIHPSPLETVRQTWEGISVRNMGRHWGPAVIALSMGLLALSFAACGGSQEAREDVPTAAPAGETSAVSSPTVDAAGGTSSSAPPTATPVAERPSTSGVSLDEYITMVCGEAVTEVGSWEEGDSLRELSEGLGFVIEGMGALEPPEEVAEWHHAQISFAGAFREAIDDFLDDPGDRTEDQFLLSAAFGLASHFEPVELAIDAMDPDVRTRMAEAGCIDEQTSEPVPPQLERGEIPVGGSVSGTLGESEITYYQFQAEEGRKYLIAVSWEGITRVRLLIKDPPDPYVDSISQSNSSDSPLILRWTAPETGMFQIDLYALKGTGSFNISVSLDATPDSPSGVSAIWEGSTMKIGWDPVDGAEYYILYHDGRGVGCELDNEGRPRFCDELATDVVDTNYIHASPEPRDSLRGNYYWVVACNSDGCSEIDSDNPVGP